MIQIRFNPGPEQRRALGWLPGRFAFKSWPDGTMVVPEEALPLLALEGILFSVEGPAKYDEIVPSVRNPASSAVQ